MWAWVVARETASSVGALSTPASVPLPARARLVARGMPAAEFDAPDAGFDELASDEAVSPLSGEIASASPPTVTVLVDLNGTGAGTITGSVSCAGQQTSCPVATTAGANLTFTAAPQAGMTFTGWTGACTGLSPTCAVTASDGLLVVANFRATFTAVTSYYHLDALGSVRAITDAAGAVVERHDFRPFGADTEPLPGAGTDARRFAGEERDGTGLDYFGARYFSLVTGRFTSVNPIVSPAAMIDPQKWNRYAYARNNPLRFVDPTGMDDEDRDPVEIPIPPCSEECQTFDQFADEFVASYTYSWLRCADCRDGGGGSAEVQTSTSFAVVLPGEAAVAAGTQIALSLQGMVWVPQLVQTAVRVIQRWGSQILARLQPLIPTARTLPTLANTTLSD